MGNRRDHEKLAKRNLVRRAEDQHSRINSYLYDLEHPRQKPRWKPTKEYLRKKAEKAYYEFTHKQT